MNTDHNPLGIGWSHVVEEQFVNSQLGNTSTHPPSVLGALPSPSLHSSPSPVVTFRLTSFNPTVLNCTVIGPRSRPWFHIVTEPEMAQYTVVKNSGGGSVALVDWQEQPVVDVRGVVPKQAVRSWLKLSPDRRSRFMEVRGMRYIWSPQDKFIDLYTGGPSTPEFLGRISREKGAVRLDMTTYAIQLGLLDATVVYQICLVLVSWLYRLYLDSS